MWEKYIVCHACGLRTPSFESSIVLYTTPTSTSSIQELIMQGMQQKFEKSYFQCRKNTWYAESNYILQLPKYWIIIANRFKYINNNFTKDRCSIPWIRLLYLAPWIQPAGYHRSSWTIYVIWTLYYLYQLLHKNCPLQWQQNYGVWND